MSKWLLFIWLNQSATKPNNNRTTEANMFRFKPCSLSRAFEVVFSNKITVYLLHAFKKLCEISVSISVKTSYFQVSLY